MTEPTAIEILKELAWRTIGPEKQCAACSYRVMSDHVPPGVPQHWEGCRIATFFSYAMEPIAGHYTTPFGSINVVERLTENVWRYENADGSPIAETNSGNLVLPWTNINKVSTP